MRLKSLITSANVDAIYINGVYQDETKQLELGEGDINYFQFQVELVTKSGDKINISFHSFDELSQFAKAHNLI